MNDEDTVISFMGPSAVGKTCIIQKYIHGIIEKKYDPTIEDMYRKKVEMDGVQRTVDIIDTAGSNQFMTIRDMYYKTSHCIVLVFSIISRNSLDELKTILEEIKIINPDIPRIILANKGDLDSERLVMKSEYPEIEAMFGAKLYETSVMHNKNIHDAMYDAIRCACIRHNELIKAEQNKNEDQIEPQHKCIGTSKCCIL